MRDELFEVHNIVLIKNVGHLQIKNTNNKIK